MKRFLSLLFLLCLAAPMPGRAATPSETPAQAAFGQANRAFAEGKTGEAIAGYRELLQQGYSAPLLFNLGNAEAKAGHRGRALAAYDRARLLAPRDPDIEANRSFVLDQANLPAPGTFPQRLAEPISPDGWAWLFVAALTAACAGAFALAARPGAPLRLATAAALAAALLALAGLLLRHSERHRAYVIAPEATARLSPFDEAQAAFVLPDGAAVTVEDAHDGYLRVRDAKGNSGWVRQDEIEAVQP
jgi:hypothetical protein